MGNESVSMKFIQKPSVGRAVHYTSLGDQDGKYPPQCVSALVVALYRNTSDGVVSVVERINEGVPLPSDTPDHLLVDLLATYPTGQFFMTKVPFAEWPMTRGHWNWPPKV